MTICTDGTAVKMEADAYIERLVEQGLRFDPQGQYGDIAVVMRGSSQAPNWLAIGEHHGQWACCLQGEAAGEIVDQPASLISLCSYPLFQQLPRILQGAGIRLEQQSVMMGREITTT